VINVHICVCSSGPGVYSGDGGGGSSSAHPLKPRGPVAKKWRRADTNVVAIKFDRLTSPSNMHTGDPVICTGCQAMLSHISQLTRDGDNDVRIRSQC